MWNIWIDTGGTFTDCIAKDPQQKIHRLKVLSSSALRGTISQSWENNLIKIQANWKVDKDIFQGYTFRLLYHHHPEIKVTNFDVETQILTLSELPQGIELTGEDFEITAFEEAPILAARLATQTPLFDDLPSIDMRLGSTKGTNALLEGKGTAPLFLVTKGHKDLLEIGTQQRPHLFQLDIQKSKPLYKDVIEVNERIDAQGNVLIFLSEEEIQRVVTEVQKHDNPVVAITLLHSYLNPIHEFQLKAAFEKENIPYISISHDLASVIKVIPRAETTVVNAYLSPIIQEYLQGVQSKLKDGSLKVMTSAGGLIDANQFHPKDSLLSGPAGGVVGAATIAKVTNTEKLLTLDIGGTSSDVSRYHHYFDYQYESKVGNATILSPSVYIETVAAGGGSICSYDGYSFKVGPESAGAYPGPACYGAGGPLAITDVNLLLGRIHSGRFGIPLSIDKAEQKIEEIAQESQSSKEEILTGFLQIANERMAEAINKISVSKGYDPKEYALLCFGGAGGLHACQVAEILDIKKVIIPFDAGILSAYGMGMALIERFAQKQYVTELDNVFSTLEDEIEDLKRQAFEKLSTELKDGRGCTHIRQILVYLRFKGQDETIEISFTEKESLLTDFQEKYKQLYGHWVENHTIELESIKVIASTLEKDVQAHDQPEKLEAAPIHETHKSYVNGEWVETPVYAIDEIQEGHQITGPAILINQTSTSFIDINWTGYFDKELNFIAHEEAQIQKQTVQQNEGIQLELFTNRFISIAEKMGALLQRTSFSVNIKERLDFSCAILDRHGDLVVNAPHIPVHLGALGVCVKKSREVIEMNEGDVIITNHPGFGGSHLPDITLIAPVFVEGELIAYVANRAHHSEVGGKKPGSMPADATCLEEEGVVIEPQYLVKNHVAQWDAIQKVFTECNYPTRSINENLADLNAALASIHSGQQDLIELSENFTKKTVTHYMQGLKDYAQQALQNALSEWNNKQYSATEFLDDGLPIQVNIDIQNRNIIIDFEGSGGEHPNNLNATPAIINSAVLYVLRLLVDEDLPMNEGLLQNVEIKLPENSFLNPNFNRSAKECPAVVGGNVETSQRVVDTLLKALQFVACSQGTMNNLLFGNKHFGYYETICGGVGAGNGFQGASAVHQHMTNTKITDPEIFELRYPVRLEEFSIRRNSGGKGKWNGGDGILRDIRFLAPVDVTVLTQHRKEKPYGMQGGENGETGFQKIVYANGQEETLQGVDGKKLTTNDRIVLASPSGGGFGKG
ncbi:MAG: 5-oxoprolinase [Cytophagales bacterium]|nr:5-oxoprolinase [Cytophagales bacterium]